MRERADLVMVGLIGEPKNGSALFLLLRPVVAAAFTVASCAALASAKFGLLAPIFIFAPYSPFSAEFGFSFNLLRTSSWAIRRSRSKCRVDFLKIGHAHSVSFDYPMGIFAVNVLNLLPLSTKTISGVAAPYLTVELSSSCILQL